MQKKATIILLAVAALMAVALAAVVYGQSDSCRSTISGDSTIAGQWTSSDCESSVRRRGYADYFTFQVAETSEVTITLESSDADPYLYLRAGDATSGDTLHRSTSEIQESLDAGSYTIEATTYFADETGSYTLTITGLPDAPDPTPTAEPTPTPEPTATPLPTATPGPTVQPTPGPTVQPTPDPTPPPTAMPESLSQMIERVRPAVVKITNDADGGTGSGAIFKTEGMNAYVVTNYHVADNTLTVGVTVGDATVYSGTVLGIDEARDLAVLRICCGDFTALEFGDVLNTQVGDTVIAIGYPYDDVQPVAEQGPERVIVPGIATVTQGIVSAFRYDTPTDTELIQTDTPINPGNSGGPLLTVDGLIIGINTFILRNTEGLNYAVSESTVQSRLPDLIAGISPPRVVEVEPHIVRYSLVGPDAGHFHHDALDGGLVGLVSTGIPPRKNVAAQAWFRNPYSGQVHAFSYGFIVRDRVDSDLRLYIHSDGRWVVSKWTQGGGLQTVVQGQTGDLLRTGAYQYNHLSVAVLENFGSFSLNGQALTDSDGASAFDLGTDTGAGAAHIANGLETGTERLGAITHYEGLFVDEFIVYGPVTTADVQGLLTEAQPVSPLPANAKAHHARE